MLDRLLVPLDGSTFSEAALPVALSVARRSGAEIRLLTVHEPVPAFAYDDWEEAARKWAHGYLADVIERIRPHAGGEPTTAVREGHVVDCIRAEGRDWGADAVVMASHGRGAVSRVWLGSVADGVVRHSRRPVLLVRPDDDERPDPGVDVGIRRIVVPLDGSQLSESVLDKAAGLARVFDAVVSLLRVVSYPLGPTSPYLPQTVETNRQVMEEAREAAEDELTRVAARLRERDLTADATVVTDQHPAHAILEHAGDDPVAMATHGRGGVSRALLGSVADKVIRGARGPVLVHRPEN